MILKTIMDYKFLKADRKAVTEAVVQAASEVARAFMEKKYEYFDGLMADLKDPEAFRFEVERKHAERRLKQELEDYSPLDDLFDEEHLDESFHGGVTAAIEAVAEEPPKGDLPTIDSVKWDDLSKDCKAKVVELFAKNHAEHVSQQFKEYFVNGDEDMFSGARLEDVYNQVTESIRDDDLGCVYLDERFAFVQDNVQQKRKASDDPSEGDSSKRACP